MKNTEIFIDFAAHPFENYLPTDDYALSTHQFSTDDFLLQITKHYGISFDQADEISADATGVVDALKAIGFKYVMIPGTASFKWLLIAKRVVL